MTTPVTVSTTAPSRVATPAAGRQDSVEVRRRARARRWRHGVGVFFVWTAGIHVGIAATDPETYRDFADAALFEFVRTGWAEVFMANPLVWAMLLAAAELAAGLLLLGRGRAVRLGWIAVIAFHALLMLFGFGFWLWSVPALVGLVLLARADRWGAVA